LTLFSKVARISHLGLTIEERIEFSLRSGHNDRSGAKRTQGKILTASDSFKVPQSAAKYERADSLVSIEPRRPKMDHVQVDLSEEDRNTFRQVMAKSDLPKRMVRSVRAFVGLDDNEEGGRTIYVGADKNADFKYPDNRVITSRYNMVTFLPLFLIESFKKFANTYFLIVSILQAIPIISITDGIPLSLAPLSIVLFFEGIVTALEDRQRHKDDFVANSSKCLVIEKGVAVQKAWRDIKVGDIVKLRNRDQIPADCLILAASDDPPQGVCYVETKSLDGETNLKLKQGLIETAEAVDSYAIGRIKSEGNSKEAAMDKAVSAMQGKISCEAPNSHLDTFTGTAQFQFARADGSSSSTARLPLSLKNIMLRGCVVRSTDFVYALVINTGHDTKIMKSMVQTRAKMSSLDKTINKMLFGFVILELSMCFLGAGLAWDWVNVSSWDNEFIYEDFGLDDFFVRGCTFFLLIANMIPISLYVSMKIIRVCQSIFIWWDAQMVNEGDDPLTGERFVHRAKVRTMDLCDTIGQVSYIFSDKTGTLTNNVMEFRKMSIAGKAYGQGTTIIGVAALERDGKMKEAREARNFLDSVENAPHPRFINFVQDGFGASLQRGEIPGGREFLTALALCHEVLVESIRDDNGQDTGKVRLSASSPDDQALVVAAAEMGFKFSSRGEGGRTISVLECAPTEYIKNRVAFEKMTPEERIQQEEGRTGTLVTYELLETLEFTSTRKRASVIVRDRRNGEIRLFCKGADSEVFKRLSSASSNSSLAHATNQQITAFADDGLRTLTIAYKRLSDSEFSSWLTRYRVAIADLQEQEKRKRKEENMIDTLMDEIEIGLELLGATAIEDKLQDQVPETIKSLAEAGIKLWVLTGDKQETAINIAWACQLIDSTMTRITISTNSARTKEEMVTLLQRHKQDVDSSQGTDYALIIDGAALKLALIDPEHDPELNKLCESLLVSIAIRCKGVVCCRVSPKQKAEVVTMVRKYLTRERTLAIGDGANDVGMIQCAHVGVGISGLEGMQAVNAADIALGRFKYLKRLLLLHGRTNYRRTAKLVMLILYKNIFMIVAQVIWSHANGYSGQKFYFQLGVEGYNLLFTNSILLTAIFDKDLPDRYLLQIPALYELGRESTLLNYRVFWSYVLNAWYQAILAYVLMYFCYQVPFREDIWMMGTMLFTVIVAVANVKVALEAYAWNWIMVLGYLIVFFSWPLCALFFESRATIGVRFGWEFQSVFTDVVFSLNTWALWLLMFVALLIRDFAWKVAKREFFPELRHLMQEHAKMSGKPFTYMGPVEDLDLMGIPGYRPVSPDGEAPIGKPDAKKVEVVVSDDDVPI